MQGKVDVHASHLKTVKEDLYLFRSKTLAENISFRHFLQYDCELITVVGKC